LNLLSVSIFLVDNDEIPKAIRFSIKKAEQEAEYDIINFQG
jgi:hypothetical protein